jgi:hypothetical protein
MDLLIAVSLILVTYMFMGFRITYDWQYLRQSRSIERSVGRVNPS